MDERAKQIEALIEDLITEARGFGRVQQAKANLLAALRSTKAASSGVPAACQDVLTERGVVTLDMVASMKRDLPVLRDTPNLSLGLAMSRAILGLPPVTGDQP